VSFAARFPAAFSRLSRRRDGALIGGVCSGLGQATRIDPTVLRLVFAFLAVAEGAGVLAYAAAWAWLPREDEQPPGRFRRVGAAALLVLAAMVALSSVGVGDAVVWAAAAVGAGVFLALNRSAQESRPHTIVRTGAAAALVIGGGVLFLSAADNDNGSLVPLAGVVALFLVIGPWAWRLAREQDAERLERIRAQERADMAARVHDSVLQTLALVQRDAADAKRVAALARRQERALRGWLYGGGSSGETLRAALEETLADVEEVHGVRVEIVASGDRDLDDRVRALVLAAREAVTNAAVHSGVTELSVYVEAGANDVAVYVRDRGSGFDPGAVAPDRRGIAESVVGRMERHGGSAVVRSAPGEGTEVELRLPLGDE
jgi:signal transduction histidine kinase